MPSEVFYPYQNDEYNRGIVLEDYNDELNLVAGVKTSNGNVYKRWGFPQKKDKTASKKAIPWKIRLGSPREAVAALKYLLSQIETQGSEPSEPDDIPF